MKFLALIYADESGWEQLSHEEQQAWSEKYRAFGRSAAGKIVDGAATAPTRTATTVRIREGQVLTTDGPYAETKEQLGGFYVLECDSPDEAVELAQQIPGAAHGVVEIRPQYVEATA